MSLDLKEKLFSAFYRGQGSSLPRPTKSRAAHLAYSAPAHKVSLQVNEDEDGGRVLDMCVTASKGDVWMRCYPRYLLVSLPGETIPVMVDYLGFSAWAEKTKIF